jgi:hypothetical protein
MADDNFRSYRSRDPLARDEANPTAREGASDPLAELARLIGQGDPYADGRGHETYSPERSGDDTGASGADWATDDGYAAQGDRAEEDRYVPPPRPPSSAAPYPSYSSQARGYEDEAPAGGRYFSGQAAKFNGFREGSDARDLGEQSDYAAHQPEHEGGEAYAADDYYDEAPSPRPQSGMVVVMVVLGLAVIGIAGAFAYRTMFGGYGLTFPPILHAMLGGYSLPSLPPIIKASNGPNKIMPSYGESQAKNSAQAGVGGAGSAEKVVSREEQPVNIEPPKVNSRVVSTIPITSGQSPPPSGAAAPVPAGSTAPVPAAPSAPAPVASAPAVPLPGGAPPAPMTASTPPAASPAAPASSEPKKVHTVTIRADQSSGSDAAPVPPAPPPVARSATRPAPSVPKPSAPVNAPPTGSNAPLSIVPGAEGDAVAPAPRTRVAAAPVAVASAAPVTGAAATAPSGGGYAVQVTSQHSEADAQAAFQALRAKFPNQLSGREPIIRRADLGAKGVYYRALVGPFASAEQAAGMCSSLKAAGGNCLVQRN